MRKETKRAIERLKNLGMHTIMLTGDHPQTARAIRNESGIEDFKAECFPESKVTLIKSLKQNYGAVAMVGDGINDGPALATASVGIAVGEGTDVALETADIVLMKNDLCRIAEAVELSKRMNRIIKQNILFSISVIILLILANFIQALDLPFGVIGHEGSTIRKHHFSNSKQFASAKIEFREDQSSKRLGLLDGLFYLLNYKR